MQKIIALFAGKYGLTMGEVMAEIEAVYSAMLSRWYRLPVMVVFREDFQLEAMAYGKSGGVVMQKPVKLTEMKGRNTIKMYLEIHLAKAAVLKQTVRYKSYERKLFWGEITGRDREHNFYIEIEIIRGELVTVICPLNRIGIHERESRKFSIGRKRAFHLRRVEPVLLNGTPRLKVVVDRVSKTLVENLLKGQLGNEAEHFNIKCVKRFVGHKSIVSASKRLPKAAIIAVDRELQERVQISFGKAPVR